MTQEDKKCKQKKCHHFFLVRTSKG